MPLPSPSDLGDDAVCGTTEKRRFGQSWSINVTGAALGIGSLLYSLC